jgi:hypothetical protein
LSRIEAKLKAMGCDLPQVLFLSGHGLALPLFFELDA